MEKKYQLDDKLEFYQELLAQMCGRVIEAISEAAEAFSQSDANLAEKVNGDRFIIVQMRDLIESDGVRILISEAPYGQYMRTVIAGLKIVTSLERMGEHACHLAMAVKSEYAELDALVMEMARKDHEMASLVLDAMGRWDARKAREIAKMDDEVDALRSKLGDRIISIESGTPEGRKHLFDTYSVTKELERYGDHVTNICSWIVYTKEGVKPDLN